MKDRPEADDADVVALLKGASKTFHGPGGDVEALKPTHLSLRRGELLLIVGPSGSGKTTLLSLLGCVLYPSQGCVCIKGIDTKDLNDRQLASLRRREIGFVFQNFNLIAPLTAEENILTPLFLNRVAKEEARRRVRQALDLVNLGHRRRSLPKQLSGGEQQRVAIARALVGGPSLILCDEPTASLDSRSLDVVLKELRKLADSGKAVAVVTHDPRLKEYADKVINLQDGKVIEQTGGKDSL